MIVRQGMVQQYANLRDQTLPDKIGTAHRWVVIATHNISESALMSNIKDGEEIHLDLENLFDINVGCIDCEEVFQVTLLGGKCSAPAWEME